MGDCKSGTAFSVYIAENQIAEESRRVASFYVYIVASHSRVLYVGLTNHLLQRVAEHKERMEGSFTGKYRVDRLVYCEVCSSVWDAIRREKQIKGWTRARKIALIEAANPEWEDLSRCL